jgi:hypothetical protein
MLKKIKKNLAILLAVCFVMSVTAAAVGAVPEKAIKPIPQHIVKPLPQHIAKHKGHLVPGHWETKFVKTIVKQKVIINHHLKTINKVVYKSIKIWMPARWVV